MIDPEQIEPNQEIERKVRSVFQTQEPDPLFIDRLQKKIADGFKDIERSAESKNNLTGRLHWLDKLKFIISPLAWGAIAVILILFLAWGIKTLIPRVEPSLSTKSTPLPSMVPTIMPTQAEGGEGVIHLPVIAGTTVPWPEEAITSENASRITELARWGKETISAVAWAPDGKTFAVVSDGIIHIYDSATFQEISTIDNGSNTYQVAYSPDGIKIATIFNDSMVKIWDVTDGSELITLSGHSNFITCLAYLPDGEVLASAAYGEPIKLWSTTTGEELRTFGGSSIGNFAISPDGAYLATAENTLIKLWDVANGQEIRSFTGHTDYTYELAFSPDGKTLASTSNDKTIKLWDVYSGNELRTIQDQAIPNGVAFLPDGRTLITLAQGGLITLRDVATGQTLRTLGDSSQVSNAQVINFILSPDGKTVLTYGFQGDAIMLLDIASGEELYKLDWQTYIVYKVAFSQDGRMVAVGLESGVIKLLDATNGRELRTLSGHTKEVETMKAVQSLAFSPDGTMLVSGAMDETTRLWDVASGQELNVMDGVIEFGWGGGIPSVDFSPDGKLLAFGAPNGQVKVWDAINRMELFTLGGQTDSVFADPIAAVAFSPDGKILATGYASHSITLWDTLNGQELRTLSDPLQGMLVGISSLEFSPNGKVLAAGDYGAKINVWDITSGSKLYTLSLPWDDEITSLDFSPDGNVLAIGSGMVSTVLVDANSGQQMIDLGSAANGLAFSPDGKILITGAFDGAMHLWGIAPGNTIPAEGVVTPAEVGIVSTPMIATQVVPEDIGIEKIPIPMLLSGEGLQSWWWSPGGSYFPYSQQSEIGEAGPDQATATLYFLDARTGEICPSIQETVTFTQTEWGPSPMGSGMFDRTTWMDDNHLLYISPENELLVLSPCNDVTENWTASLPEVINSIVDVKQDHSQIILRSEQAYWLLTPSTLQSIKLDIPLPDADTYTSVGWMPGEEMLYTGRIEDRQGMLWIVLDSIDPGTGSASQILEVEASPEIRNSSPMWPGIDWMGKDKVIVENTIDGMKLYDISSRPIQSTNLFPDVIGIEDPGMYQLSAWGPMCAGDEKETHLMLETGFASDGQYYIYHPDTGVVDQYPLDPPLFVIYPCGEGGIAQSYESSQSNTYNVILVDSGVEPYDLVVRGHSLGQNNWSFATILPGAQKVMFSSTQGISLVDLKSSETLSFWSLENQVEYQDFTAMLSPDGKTVVGFAAQKGAVPGAGSSIQDIYWLRLEP